RQIVSQERVHVLACNWRLQRRPRAQLGRPDETDIAGRAATRTCAESDRPKTPSSGQLGSRVGKFELGARLETMTKAARQDMRPRRRWLRDESRSCTDVVARARIVVHA